MGWTKYFRRSTSSKYSRVPTSFGECRMLHGRLFQKSRTRSIGTSAKLDSAAIVRRRRSPEACEDVRRQVGRAAAVREVVDPGSAGQLLRKDSPEVHDEHPASLRLEVGGGKLYEFGIRRRDDDDIRVAQTVAGAVENQHAAAELEVRRLTGQRVVGEHARSMLEERLRDHDR